MFFVLSSWPVFVLRVRISPNFHPQTFNELRRIVNLSKMASEAQRLINISLGKIASSRSQRGGLRLHKSLMVANIIVQARTKAMMESVNSSTRSQPSERSSVDDENNSINENHLPINNNNHDSFRSSATNSDFDSDCESSLGSDDEMSVDFELDFGKIVESDMTSPPRKRKRLDDDDEETSLNPAKKFFTSTELHPVSDDDERSLSAVDCSNGLLDSLQMCHLTQDLSNGFASQSIFENHVTFDKLNHDYDLSTSDFIKAQPVFETRAFDKMSASSSESYDLSPDDSDYNKDISLFQSDGLNDGVSCSTQIREALDTLTRPVISLTV